MLESFDDENGETSGPLERACDLHRQAAVQARPDPLELAAQLYDWETDAGVVDLSGGEDLYAAALGAAGVAEYRRLAEADWRKVPRRGPPKPGRQSVFEHDSRSDAVMRILDRFAERDADVEMRIALRSKDLSTPDRYLALAHFCLGQGRAAEALEQAEEALWLFEDGGLHRGLVLFVAGLLAAEGRPAEAEQPLLRAFEARPDEALYDALARAGGSAAAERARTALRQRLEGKQGGWLAEADLRAAILLKEGRFAEAWQVARRFQVRWPLVEQLIQASGKAFPEDAVAGLKKEAEGRIVASNYAEAVSLLRRLEPLQGPATHAAYLADLRDRHARKRNFLKLLP